MLGSSDTFALQVDDTVIKVYCLGNPSLDWVLISHCYCLAQLEIRIDLYRLAAAGEFFMPCWGADLVCQRQLDRGLSQGTWDTANLVGRHWFAGTWNTPEQLLPKNSKRMTPPYAAGDAVQLQVLHHPVDIAAITLESHGDLSHMW